MVQTAHIRNLGYPVWLSFDAFMERFGPLEVLPIRKQKCFTLKLDFYNLGLIHTEKKSPFSKLSGYLFISLFVSLCKYFQFGCSARSKIREYLKQYFPNHWSNFISGFSLPAFTPGCEC